MSHIHPDLVRTPIPKTMEGLVRPERLRARILLWTEEETRLGNLPRLAFPATLASQWMSGLFPEKTR